MLSGDCMRKNSKDKYIGQMYKSNRGDIAEVVKYNSGHEDYQSFASVDVDKLNEKGVDDIELPDW